MTSFERIAKQETNENTALILMLGIISEKLTEIIRILKDKKTNNKQLTIEDLKNKGD